jgi:hypothetical protein
MNDLKFKYVSKWEKAREEQNTARLCQSEKKLECQLTELKDNISMELKCHVEIETYMRQAIAVSKYRHKCHSLDICQHLRLSALYITKQVRKCPQGVKLLLFSLCYCPFKFSLCLSNRCGANYARLLCVDHTQSLQCEYGDCNVHQNIQIGTLTYRTYKAGILHSPGSTTQLGAWPPQAMFHLSPLPIPSITSC